MNSRVANPICCLNVNNTALLWSSSGKEGQEVIEKLFFFEKTLKVSSVNYCHIKRESITEIYLSVEKTFRVFKVEGLAGNEIPVSRKQEAHP